MALLLPRNNSTNGETLGSVSSSLTSVTDFPPHRTCIAALKKAMALLLPGVIPMEGTAVV
ncbi:hypothetical protein U9R62_06945 [Cylindrospermopsis raciborskii DSH]|uniref:hypothetical protein n=1 Tax=Cylindrospermopsis raciborskii TaxID=77022 RepID=UPI002ED9625C